MSAPHTESLQQEGVFSIGTYFVGFGVKIVGIAADFNLNRSSHPYTSYYSWLKEPCFANLSFLINIELVEKSPLLCRKSTHILPSTKKTSLLDDKLLGIQSPHISIHFERFPSGFLCNPSEFPPNHFLPALLLADLTSNGACSRLSCTVPHSPRTWGNCGKPVPVQMTLNYFSLLGAITEVLTPNIRKIRKIWKMLVEIRVETNVKTRKGI